MHILSGKFKGRQLQSPKGARPTLGITKQAIFNICQNQIEGAAFLDLFAASGAMGLEALSNGAASVTFVEKDATNCRLLKQNIETLNQDANTCIIKQDVFKALEYLGTHTFDLIYADPPYSTSTESLSKKVLQKLDSCHILKEDGLLFLEDSSEYHMDIPLNHLKLIDKKRFGQSKILIYQMILTQ
ncbi:MAG: Ribosomal RNA small subunit methyltransferase D [Chlamydiae bacterium]|nr:Ribosomal RNA small subunit methyltransferase D [Chlamydiota bacterium]